LQYSTYSVISPEGCASILWKSAEKASDAAEALGITSTRLSELGLVDQVISEPLGGAHRDVDVTAGNIKAALLASLEALAQVPPEELIEARYHRLMAYGKFSG
jgi:acetyl-CoA carboxylase carboxyl transferase subunit alpha